MAPQAYSYRPPSAELKQAVHPSPFQGSSPEDYDVSASEVDSDNQPIMTHLLRRSRSLTDAQLTDELQPNGRRRSFFSKRKLKPAQDQPDPSITAPVRSLSGLLASPGQARASEPDSKRPTGSTRAESKSRPVKGDSDSDATANKPKSARWWSWGSSTKALKSDGKVLSPRDAASPAGKGEGSNSRPSSLELAGHSADTNGAASSAAFAHPSPLMQSGCMSIFTTAPGQPEKPLSEVQWTDSDVSTSRGNPALNNSYTVAASQSSAGPNTLYAPDGVMPEAEGNSPSPQQSKLKKQVGHSRHVSWENEAVNGSFQDSGGLGMYQDPDQRPFTSPFVADRPPPDTGSPDMKAAPSPPTSPASHGTSLLSNAPQTPQPIVSQAATQAPLSAVPGSSTAPGSLSLSSDAGGALPASAAPTTAAPGAAATESESALSVQTGDVEKQKKGHRRGRSLTGLIPTLKTKPKRSQSQLFETEPTTPAAGSSGSQAGRPRTPDGKAATSNSSSLGQCFGMGRTLEDNQQEEHPLGVVGLRNLGNTCFVNVALQCLRYTPKLPQAIYPDLLRFSLMEQEPVAMPVSLPSSIEAALSCDAACHSASELPSVPETTALADQSADISTPSAPVHSQANGPAPSNLNSPFHEQSVHNTGQANPVLSAAEAQQSVPSMSQQPEVPMLQLLQDRPEQPQLQSSQPVSIPGPHNGMVSHPQPPAQHQLQGSSPDLGAESEWTGLSGSNTSHQTASISDPPAGDASPSGPFELAAGQQQAQQQPQQLAGAAAESVPGDDSAQAPANQSTAAKQPPPVPVARVPLKKGEIAESFRALVKQVYAKGNQYAVDPAQFLHRIAQLPLGAEFCDGGQHDAQELFRLLLDSLHDDLNRISKKPGYEEDKDLPGEAETDKAERLWRKYLAIDNSPITDLFGGQLQSTVHCHKCKGNFTTYEPFWDLSLPIVKEGKGGLGAWLSGKSIPTTIQDCLQAFTVDEVLQGDEAFKCEVCDEKTEATKRLRLYRLPQVLLLHIKRFKYSGTSREKLTNNVTFPIKGLKLNQFVSSVSSPADSNASYDLYAVSNHYGSMAGGHYTAACRVGLPGGREQWYNFNDDAVSKLSPQNVVTPCAYMLFYVRSE